MLDLPAGAVSPDLLGASSGARNRYPPGGWRARPWFPSAIPGGLCGRRDRGVLARFAVRSRKRLRHDPTTAAVLLAEDTDDRWRFAGTPDGLQVEVGAEVVAPTIVSGPAHHLYLLVWNRNSLDQLTLTGSPDPVEWLLQVLRVTWG